MGTKRCYLNIDEEEAIRQYCVSQGSTREEFEGSGVYIDTIEFNDEFGAYEIYE